MMVKRFSIIGVATVVMAAVLLLEIVPWVLRSPNQSRLISALCLLSGIGWIGILWWGLYRLTFQLAGLLPEKAALFPISTGVTVNFAVLYVTRDDFSEDCCVSCVEQDYAPGAFQAIVCDDSRSGSYQTRIDQFCRSHASVQCVRRTHRMGYKAGNLNHAFQSAVAANCDWVIIADADQWLPRDFLSKLATVVASLPEDVAFVQAGREPFSRGAFVAAQPPESLQAVNLFQIAMGHEVRLFFERDLSLRETCGFLPFLGHGGAIRYNAWKRLQGFPLVVSEDYGFSMIARSQGLHGRRVAKLRSWETYPKDFGAFLVRISKFASGAAELLRRVVPEFLRSEATLTEKCDVIMWLATYALAPVSAANIILSGYLCHRMWNQQISLLPPHLPYLFIAMLVFTLPVLISIERFPGRCIRYWFWSFAVYTAALPLLAASFIVHLFKTPAFRRTPKGCETSPAFTLTGALTVTLGAAILVLAVLWRSPFSPLLASSGLAYVSFPVLQRLHEDSSVLGWFSRRIVWLPGILFVVGVVVMWLWATN